MQKLMAKQLSEEEFTIIRKKNKRIGTRLIIWPIMLSILISLIVLLLDILDGSDSGFGSIYSFIFLIYFTIPAGIILGLTVYFKKDPIQSVYKLSRKNLGIIFIVTPIACFISAFIYFKLTTLFVNNWIHYFTNHLPTIIVTILYYFIQIGGEIGVSFMSFGAFVGVLIGINFLVTKKNVPVANYDLRSGEGNVSEIPEEIKGWNWGAAGLSWLWGIYHNVWLSLLQFVPVLGWFWWIVLGVKGNEWAWRAKKWESVEQFKKVQRRWRVWGMGVLVCILLYFLLRVAVSIIFSNATVF